MQDGTRTRQILAGLIALMAVVALTCVLSMEGQQSAKGPAPKALLEFRQKMSAIHELAAGGAPRKRVMEQLDSINFGGTAIGNEGSEEGNQGAIWNYGANWGGKETVNPTQHSGGVGQFGSWGVKSSIQGTSLCLDHTDDANDCGSLHYGSAEHGYSFSYHYINSCDADEGCVYAGYSGTFTSSKGESFTYSYGSHASIGDGVCDHEGTKPGPNFSCYCGEQSDCQ